MPIKSQDEFVRLATVETLYHYCSMATAKLIFENKTLRLSSIDHMNDPHEYRYFLRLALAHIKDNPTLNDQQRSTIWDYFSKEYLENVDHITEDSFANVYCFCMSMLSDDLSQWRGYGDEGYGIAIGFRKLGLLEFKAAVSRNALVELNYVRYNEEELLAGLAKTNLSPQLRTQDGTDLAPMFAAHNLKWMAPRFKHNAYKAEQEWRLIFSPPGFVMASENGRVNGIHFKTMIRGKTVVPCYDFDFSPSIIHSIRLGPNVSKLSEIGLRMMLDVNGFAAVPMERSKIGYRSQW